MPVGRITLFIFGGVSNIEKEASPLRTEFLITIVEPLTSNLLGILYAAISGVGATSLNMQIKDPQNGFSELSPLARMLLWLGPVNFILGLFILLPGFPLDGG